MADRNGETTTLSYASGKLATVTESSGRALAVTWTGTHITEVTDPLNHSVQYGYDAAGNLTTVTGPDGAVSTFGYDSTHRITSLLDPQQHGAATTHPIANVYDSLGRVTTQTDQLGRVTTFMYAGDAYSSTGGTTVVTDPAGHQRADVYQYGLRTTTVRGFGTAAASTTVFTYDSATLGVTSSTTVAAGDPNTHKTTATYDANGNALTQIDAVGRETDTTYNNFDEPLTVTMPNPSPVGPTRITTTYAYDIHGNALSKTVPLYTSATVFTNQTTTYQRGDTAHPGDVTGTVDPLGKVTTNTYDSAGNLMKVVSPQGRITKFSYDSIGRKLTEVAPAGNTTTASPTDFTTTYGYDAASRLTSTSVAATDGALVTAQTYDADGRLTTQTDPLGNVTRYTYDLASELTVLTRPDGTTQQTGYFADGVVQSQTDGTGKALTYAEDALGRIASSTDPLSRVTSYTYDAVNAVLTTTDPAGQSSTNTYNAAGDLLTTSYSDGTTSQVARTYNSAGFPATLVDGTGTTTFTYDSLGRLTSQAAPNATVGYGYNLRDQVTTLTYPNGKNVTRAYADDGSMTSVVDWLGGATTFTYDANGALSGATAPNGVTTTIGRDNPGRITSLAYASASTTLGALDYGWDADSRLTTETSTNLGPDRTYTYDDNSRISGDSSAAYGYDNADRLTTNATATQAYDNASQLTTVTSSSTTTTYTFDQRGNRTKATGIATTNYGYDQADRLTSYSTGSTSATYAYNGDGLRVSKTVAGVTTKFGYDTGEGLPLVLTDGTANYVYGPAGEPIEQITDTTPVYLHTDQAGSVRLLTANDGSTAGTAQYTAYGARTTTGTTTSPLGFAGQYTDAESGLLDLRARYYDPATAAFLTVDPALSGTRSAYGYASGNPVTGGDPTGLCGLWCKIAVGTVVGAVVGLGVVVCAVAEPCGAIAAGALVGGGSLAAGGLTLAGASEIVVTGAAAGAGAGAIYSDAQSYNSMSSSSSSSSGGGSSGETCSDGTVDHIWDQHRFGEGGTYYDQGQTENVFSPEITKDKLKEMIDEAMQNGTKVARSTGDPRGGYYKDYAFDDIETGLNHQNGLRLTFDEFGNLTSAMPRFVY
jgi:RHS repeat-associated protein